MSLALFWLSTFGQVFVMGLQSRNVNTGRYGMAAMTSLAIGGMSIINVRGMVQLDPLVTLALVGTAGPLGIVTSMFFFRRVIERGGKTDPNASR